LKRAYRDRIRTAAGEPVAFVHLAGSRDLIARRMAARKDHFMPPGLLGSQFATLELPEPGEGVIEADIGASPQDICDKIASQLGAPGQRAL
jgi:gluconokinase